MTAFIILNPHSGGGRVGEHDLVARAHAAGARTHVMTPDDDPAAIAATAADAGATILGMAGGDGSLGPVAGVAVKRGLPFLCLPAGTLNHFARDAGLDTDDPADALRALGDGREKRVDVGELNDTHTFLNVVSLGLYAAMVADPDYRHAKGRVARNRLEDALEHGLHPAFDATLPGGTVLRDVLVLLVSNNPYEFPRLRWDAERFRLNRGRLGLAAIALPPGEARQRRGALARVVLRGRDRSEFWHEWTTDTWVQEFGDAGQVPIALDGEPLTVRTPLRLRIRPGALRLLVLADVPDERSRDPRVASRHSAAFAWHALRRWIRVTRSRG
jgi:diacylglycerol kinase family enzyme